MEVSTLDRLRTDEGTQLLAAAREWDGAEDTLLALVERLRKGYDAELVSAAVSQVRLRRRAVAKFGADAEAMFFTADGLEQATRSVVAAHRAGRFAGADRVLDLCCGIGSDLIALARAGLTIRGVDRDPITAAIAAANAEVPVDCADVTSYDVSGWPAAFCDPARRAGDRRIFDPSAYSPPLPFVLDLPVPRLCVKVAPGIPHDAVPERAEAEWISVGGDVCEAALWLGEFVGWVRRRATLLPAGVTLEPTGIGTPEVRPPGRFLYEPDGAVIRAYLVAEVAALVDGWLLDPTIAYVAADRLLATPFATAYEISDVVPFSVKRLRALLRSRGVGRLTVKKRGSAVEPEQLRRDLRLSGEAEATVVLTRVAGAPTALLCQRVVTP